MIFHISNQTNRGQTTSIPVDIFFQGIPYPKAVEEAVIKHANRLKRIRADLMRCRVSLAVGAKRQHQGKPFDVNVHVFIPHRTHVSSNTLDEDPYAVLHETSSHVKRMLLEAGSKRSSQP